MVKPKLFFFFLNTLTCNVAELVDKRQRHWYCRLQFEEEAGGQRLVRRLGRRQEHRMTNHTPHKFTTSAPPALTFTAACQSNKKTKKTRGSDSKKRQHVTPGDPAVEAVGAAMPSEACEPRR